MDSQAVWLPTALYTALIRLQLNDFTATGCVTAVFGAKAESKVHRKRYDIIYWNLIKLVRLGLLKRKHVDDGRRFSHFIKTPKFDEVHFKEEFIGPEALVTELKQEKDMKLNSAVLDELDARAQNYRLQLEKQDAMRDELGVLLIDFPFLEPAIGKAISDVVEESWELQGRLAAVERILKVFGMRPSS
ncbi:MULTISPECIES: hypothetical protein [Aeromonas]|uniref:hypothetical protein n=1 Tax=Aeromonas TaxID=642 RepID=UPI0022E831D5|nr:MULTISPECIES: hypothetical protein [Aeromonas]